MPARGGYGVSVGRGGTLIEYKLRTAFPLLDGAPKDIVFLPPLQHVVVRLRQVQAGMLGKSLSHTVMIDNILFCVLNLRCKGNHLFRNDQISTSSNVLNSPKWRWSLL